jgi:hypothetical protein
MHTGNVVGAVSRATCLEKDGQQRGDEGEYSRNSSSILVAVAWNDFKARQYLETRFGGFLFA